MKNALGVPLVIGVLGFVLPAVAPAADSPRKNDQEQEYIQVRKIALKDPRVQDAFQRAEERLNDRILEIDPSLKPYMDKRNSRPPAAAEPVKARAVATPAKHTGSARTGAGGGVHIVAKGETLSSIAGHYNVTVASLKAANNITDERKLGVGQKLVIPASKTKSAAKKTETPPQNDGSFWDKVKSDL